MSKEVLNKCEYLSFIYIYMFKMTFDDLPNLAHNLQKTHLNSTKLQKILSNNP